jgi:hypothetical protein
MFYRFAIGSDEDGKENNCALLCFTVEAENEPKAIQKAQSIVNCLQQNNCELGYSEMGDKIFTDPDTGENTKAIAVCIYAGDTYKVTKDNIDDWWEDA